MKLRHLQEYLGMAGLCGLLSAQVALGEDGASLPIKKIWVDASKQVVIEFGEKAFPQVPHVLDLPGPNHRVVLDFTAATLDQSSLPSVDQVSAQVSQALPFVKSVRYADLTNTAKPTARIVLDLPEAVKVKPHVVKLEEGQITISLGDDAQPIADASGVSDANVGSQAAEPTAPAQTAQAPVDSAQGNQSWDWLTNGQGNAAGGQSSAAASAPPAEATAQAATPAAAPAAAPEVVASPASQPATPAANAAPAAPPTEAVAQAAAPAETVPDLKPPIPVDGAQVAPATAAAPVEAPAAPATAAAPAAESAPAQPVAEAPAAQPQPAATTAEATATGAAGGATSDTKVSNVDAIKHYNAAVQFHLTGKLAEAISEYQAALAANPNLAEAHSNLGLIFNQQHNYAQALSEFRKALAVNPKDAITYNGIGAALRAQKDLLGAIKNWQTAVSLDSHLATAHYNLGTAYEIQKEYERALDSYQAAVKNDYRLGEAYYRMGLIMERKHKITDAAEQFSQALKVSGNSEYSEDARQRLAFLSSQAKKTKK